MSEETNADEFGLVMPFVVCASSGGPFDDDAYVAGWEAAQYAFKLRMAKAAGLGLCEGWVRTGNVPQLDLVAMDVGAVMTRPAAVAEAEGWTYVRFVWAGVA